MSVIGMTKSRTEMVTVIVAVTITILVSQL